MLTFHTCGRSFDAQPQDDAAEDGWEVNLISFKLSGAAPGKPRMTRRDKWKKRKCVVEYFAWCDRLRAAAPAMPNAEDVDDLIIMATYVPPASWSKAKRNAAMGTKKRSKPDGDNVLKAVCDALWENDEALGDKHESRRWGERDEISIVIQPVCSGLILPPLLDCSGCTDPRSEGTHFTPSKQHGEGA